MTSYRNHILPVIVLTAAFLSASALHAQQLGIISFPTSGAAAAQPSFIEGVKELHSFQFDEAALAFQKAEQTDPNFAMAFWGEAMSHNHPLWADLWGVHYDFCAEYERRDGAPRDKCHAHPCGVRHFNLDAPSVEWPHPSQPASQCPRNSSTPNP